MPENKCVKFIMRIVAVILIAAARKTLPTEKSPQEIGDLKLLDESRSKTKEMTCPSKPPPSTSMTPMLLFTLLYLLSSYE